MNGKKIDGYTRSKERSVDKTGKPMAIHAQTTDLQPRVIQSEMTPMAPYEVHTLNLHIHVMIHDQDQGLFANPPPF